MSQSTCEAKLWTQINALPANLLVIKVLKYTCKDITLSCFRTHVK